MNVYWRKLGGHIHCAFFRNGKCGDLVFHEEEWTEVAEQMRKAGWTLREQFDSADALQKLARYTVTEKEKP